MTPKEGKKKADLLSEGLMFSQGLARVLNKHAEMGVHPTKLEVYKPGDMFCGKPIDNYYINFETFTPND